MSRFLENYLDILNNNRERFYGEKLLVYNEETRQTFLIITMKQ